MCDVSEAEYRRKAHKHHPISDSQTNTDQYSIVQSIIHRYRYSHCPATVQSGPVKLLTDGRAQECLVMGELHGIVLPPHYAHPKNFHQKGCVKDG